MNIERRLLSRAFIDRKFDALLQAGITEGHFTDPDHQKVFTWGQKYYRRHQTSPSTRRVEEAFPDYRLLPLVRDPLSDCIEQVKQAKVMGVVFAAMDAVADAAENKDALAAQDALVAGVRRLGQETTEVTEENFQQTLSAHVTMLKERANQVGDLVGLPTGFNTLDYATRGLQPGELYSIIGLMKAGKSTMMMSIGQHLQQHGVPVYYVNFEMPVVVQKSRYLALGAHVDYDKLERNTLKKTEWRKVDEFVQESSEWPASFIHCTDMQRSATVEGLESLVLRNEPGVLMVDGIYFMRDSETKQSGTDWKAFTNITRGMKRLAQQYPLPVIVSHQATEGKTRRDSQRRGWRHLDMFSAAYGQNLGQDSDVMIGIEFDEDREWERLIKIMASRHCTPGHEKWVPWDWMSGFIGDKDDVNLTEYTEEDDDGA